MEGHGLPEECLEKARAAQSSVQKVTRGVVGVLTQMQGHRGNKNVDERMDKMGKHLELLRDAEGVLEGIVLLHQGRNKKPISCEEAPLVHAIASALIVVVVGMEGTLRALRNIESRRRRRRRRGHGEF